MKPPGWAAALLALALAAPAASRPFTVEDFLHLESLGAATADPTGRWLILDKQGPYDAAARFDDDVNTRPLSSHLERVDLRHPGMAAPAFDQDRRGGFIAGPFSPSGRFLAVYRNLERRWEIGVLTVATRQVRWLGFGAEFADRGNTLVWRSDTRLLALRMPDGDRFWKETLEQSAMLELPGLWRAAAEGRAATGVTVGSGRYRDVHVPDPVRTVVEINAVSGQVRSLAKGEFDALALSPSGRTLALIEASGRLRLSGDRLLTAGSELRRARVSLLDLNSGGLIHPCAGEPLVTSLRWSPVTDTLLFYSRPVGADWSDGGYRLATPDGGCSALPMGDVKPEVSLEHNSFTTAHAEWLNGAPILLGRKPGAGRSDWYRAGVGQPVNLTAELQAAPTDPVLMTADRAVFLDQGALVAVDGEGRAHRLAATGVTRVLTPRRPNMSYPLPDDGAPRGPKGFAIAGGPVTTSLWRFTGSQARRVLATPSRDETYLLATEAGLVANGADAHGVSQTTLLTPEGGAVVLARANKALAEVEFPPPVAILHPGPDGEPLKSWLYLPTPHTGRTPPLLIMAYPGASYPGPPLNGKPGAIIPVGDNPRLAASHGYAVLIPSLPTPRGQVDPGKGWDAELSTIIDAAAKTGMVDAARTGYWGHSFGGYVGLMLATETDRFKAIIAAAPMSDLISMRGQGAPGAWLTPYEEEATQALAGWSERGDQGHLMGTPWTERQRFIDNSPVFFADRIRTPILLVHGDQDVVSLSQSREMFSDLTRLGKDALFITFYGEGHNIVSPPNVRAYLNAAFAFLDTYLGAAPEPSPPPPGPKARVRPQA